VKTLDKKYYKIKEVAEMFAVNASTLRYWETCFEKLKPLKTKGNERMYSHENIRLIEQIVALTRQKGLTLSGAKKILQSPSLQSQKPVDELVEKLQLIKDEIQSIKKFLQD
jgi:DNA-binding transcriptional MerR regulator